MSEDNRAKVLNKSPLSSDQNKTTRVYFGIFFDGTLNHREQAMIGEKYREKEKEKKSSGMNEKELKKELKAIAKEIEYTGSSVQENDQSNVALLYSYFNKKSAEYVCNSYIEGIGTTEDGGTSILKGGAFGKGDTGIEAKVKKAIKQISGKIVNLHIKQGVNVELCFELFGFSRGAAAARNCVWSIMEDNKQALTEELKPRKITSIKVNYVGLFDTVSSYGWNFFSDNDVKELHLDAIQKAEKVFHICAADEFRSNFALTDVSSAKEKGKEIFIPGAHSDIGGGYPAGEYSVILDLHPFPNKTVDDVNTIISKDSLMRLGWIRDMPEKNYTIFQSDYLPLIIFKNQVKKGYSYIGLELMAKNANSNRENMFYPIRPEHTTPGQLKEIKDKAHESTSLETCQSLFSSHYKELNLRKDWLHFSSNDGSIGMGARKINGILKRNIING